ncbi:hypothetical protein [Synechococcus phage Yong-M2-251]|nr:hypothetical protein [Synechococcus phage Yong-M2-251]
MEIAPSRARGKVSASWKGTRLVASFHKKIKPYLQRNDTVLHHSSCNPRARFGVALGWRLRCQPKRKLERSLFESIRKIMI